MTRTTNTVTRTPTTPLKTGVLCYEHDSLVICCRSSAITVPQSFPPSLLTLLLWLPLVVVLLCLLEPLTNSEGVVMHGEQLVVSTEGKGGQGVFSQVQNVER